MIMSSIDGIIAAKLDAGPDPWAARVTVNWDTVSIGWSKRKRRRRIRTALDGICEDNIQTRYDNVMDNTIIYFRNKDDAVSAYFYLS